MRLCLYRDEQGGCPRLTRSSYCRVHYNAKRRPFYNRQHSKRAKAAIAAEPWCHSDPCPYPDAGTPANPLTGDHSEPDDPQSPLVPRCRACNSARANRRRGVENSG